MYTYDIYVQTLLTCFFWFTRSVPGDETTIANGHKIMEALLAVVTTTVVYVDLWPVVTRRSYPQGPCSRNAC